MNMTLRHLIHLIPQSCKAAGGTRRPVFAVTLLAVAALLAPHRSVAQDDATANDMQSIAPAAGVSDVLPSQSLGPSDLVQIMVPYCPELSRSFRIGPDGELSLPLLKEPIKAAGMMPVDLQKTIAQALVNDQILVNPVVNVSVLAYQSRPVSVVGAVNHPITFQATGNMTLLDALARAGGLSATVGPDITVTHRTQGADGTIHVTVQSIPVKGLIESTNARLNVVLTGNDEVRVPDAGHIFVAGNVKKPGSYAMQNNSDTTVVKALALSEGLESYTAKEAYIYRQTLPGSPREEIMVPLSKIMARKAPDMVMHPDDILYVPENNGKRMTAKVLSQLAGFGATTAAGVLIYH
jgi:polysaccharide export outer membrane protein